MKSVLIKLIKGLFIKLFSEKVLEKTLVALLVHFSKKTDNTLDDELVAIIKERLDNKENT